ncbi:apolipoprotein N-acyltransferase [Litorimonas sp. RW-G-Af-16]|uniref:apolipoprotein N-acyltransferase n=1 Tax=Litorimonas sp. RW-G-Af-16 TaxID=3241168 RepID=UPI00390C6111
MTPAKMTSETFAAPLWLRYEGWMGRGIGFLCGALAVFAFAPLHLWPLGLISFALLFLRLVLVGQTNPQFKAGLSTAFWQGLGFFGAGIFWVGSAFIARGPEFIPIMPPAVLALAALLAVFWGLAGGVFVRWRLTGLSAVIAFSAAMMLAELARGHAFGGFPWNLPGYIFEAGSRPSQFASLGNIYGLSWVVLFLSGSVALLFTAKTRLVGAALSGLILAGLYGFGHVRLSDAKTETVPNVNIRLVSVPFSQADKFNAEKSNAIVNQFLTASIAPGAEDVTHVIWPEGAVNGLAMDNAPLLNAMGRDLLSVDNSPPVWIMNSLRSEIMPHPRGGEPITNYYNSSVAVEFDAGGYPAIVAVNDKHRLVPFGEFFPGGKWLESYNFPVFSTALASISAAPEKTLIDIPGLPRVSAQICYEADFPGLTPRDAVRPAQLIINQTNDAWYGKTWGPAQHANIARYRAIEEGLPIVRSASNGLSAMIDPYGQIVTQINMDDAFHIDTVLPKSLDAKMATSLVTFIIALINSLISCIHLFTRRRLGLRRT